MCPCLSVIRGNNEGKIHYAYLLFIAAFTAFLGMAALENKIVLQVKNRIDSVLTVSGFSGTLCDLHKMSESMSVIKRETNGLIEYDFESIYDSASAYIDESGVKERISLIAEENIQRDGLMRELILDYSLDELILYNEYVQNPVAAPNGVVLDCPGIYLRIRLDIRGILGKIRTVYLDKCIVVRTG